MSCYSCLVLYLHVRTYGGRTVVLQQYAAMHGVGFNDLAVNLDLHFVDHQTGVYIQNLERSWISTKERNKRHNGTHRHILDSYLCEWIWKQRYRNLDLVDYILIYI